jgi:tetratricopeptide (TPR) repeat protein
MSALAGLLILVASAASPVSLVRGDLEFGRMNYTLAETMYVSALVESADSASVLWRLARVYVCMGDVLPRDQQLEFYLKADTFAIRCISANAGISEGHTWRAAALGNIAMFEGAKAKVRLCDSIKNHLDCAISLNPRDDIAYSILGSFYKALGNASWIEKRLAALFLGGLPDGGYDESECALQRAIILAPDVIRHHFELGDLYLRQDREAEALREFRQVVTLPVLLASDRGRQTSAEESISKLGQK